MKMLFILLLGMMFLWNVSAIDAEIKSITPDTSRNIYWVDVEYTIGTDKVINSYPVRAYNIISGTLQEVKQFILTNIKHQCRNYVANEFFKKNIDLPAKLQNAIGANVTISEATIPVDTDNDGSIDKTYKIKEDGTYEVVTP